MTTILSEEELAELELLEASPAGPLPPALDLDEPEPEEQVVAGGYLQIDTVPGQRADGETYDHTRVTVGTGMGAIVIPTLRHRGLVYAALVSQDRPVLQGATWEFVRGGTKDMSQAEANRELFEETGLVVEDTDLRRLGVLRPDTGLLTTEVAVWSTTVPTEQVPLTVRHLEFESGATTRWMHAAEIEGLIMRGEITCGMTLAAWAMAHVQGVFQAIH